MDWAYINNKRKPIVRMGERLFKAMFTDIRRRLMEEIRQSTSITNIIGTVERFQIEGDFWQAYERFYAQAFPYFVNDFMERREQQKMYGDLDEDILAEIIEFIRVNSAKRITSIMRTHYEDLERVARQAVRVGVEQGWDFPAVARAINGEYANLELWKALRIARTETVTASNEAVHFGADRLPGNKKKIWISAIRATSREDHAAMDGKTVGYDDDFVLPLDGQHMAYPSDPEAPPEHTINCLCSWDIIITSEIFD